MSMGARDVGAAAGDTKERASCWLRGRRLDAARMPAMLAVVASTCLWVLLQRGTLTAPFKDLQLAGTSLGTLLAVACLVGCALAFGALGPRASGFLARPSAVTAAGMVGGLALLGGTLVVGTPRDAAVMAASLVCMAFEAAGFCVVFLAWCQAFSFQVMRRGLSGTLLGQLVAVVLSIAVAQLGSLAVVYGVPLVDVAAMPLAAACFFGWSRARQGDGAVSPWWPLVAGRSAEAPGALESHARDVLWVVAIACALFFAGLLSYLPRLNDMTVDMGVEDPLTIGFTVAFLVPLMIACVRAEKAQGGPDRGMLVALLVVTFLFLLLFSYRVGFCPVRCFALGFLVPTYAPKLLAYGAALVIPNAAVFPVSQALAFTVAMAVTLCLVVVLFLNFDGGLARQMTGVCETPPEPAKPADRRAFCRQLGAEAGLTDRETDICYLLSQGYSGAKVCDELGISRGTLNTHSTSIYRKLDIHSKQELIDLVNDRGQEVPAGNAGTVRRASGYNVV